MYQEINSALQSFNIISNWIKANKSISNYNELIGAVSDVNAKLISAQNAFVASEERNSLLSKRIRELEEEITHLRYWGVERERYELKEVSNGVFAYIEKDFVGSFQSAHKLCANCFDQGNKTTLQHEDLPVQIGHNLLNCPRCKAMLSIQKYLS